MRRLLLLVLTMLVTSAIIFALTQLLPGDAPKLIMGRDASDAAIAQFREEFGLNDPVPQQYVRWLGGFVAGEWGTSFSSGNPQVRPLVLARLGNSLRLRLLTLVIATPLSIG